MLFLEQGRDDGQAVWQQPSTVNCIPVNKNLKIEPALFLETWCNLQFCDVSMPSSHVLGLHY